MTAVSSLKTKRKQVDWKTYFENVSAGKTGATATFGKVLNSYTIDELMDFVNAKDDEFKNLDEVSTAYMPTWQKSNAAAAQAWAHDYAKLKSDYAAARAAAQDAIDKAHGKGFLLGQVVPDSFNTSADTPYKLILQAINPSMSHDQSSNRLLQLRYRLQNAGATMTEYHVRQNVYTKEVGTTFTQATQPLVDQVETGKQIVRDFGDKAGHAVDQAKYTLWAVIAGVFVLGVVLIKSLAPAAGSIAKAYLPPPPHS
jgi:hypothetical protein